MPFTRREFAALVAALALPAPPVAAEAENAVFWRATFPSNELVLFGHVHLRADRFPEIIADGKPLVDSTRMLLLDTNPDLVLGTVEFANSDLKPLLPQLPTPYQDELRSLLAASPVKDSIDKLPGSHLCMIFLGEGQQPAGPQAPSVPVELAKYALSRGHEVKFLVSDDEVRARHRQPDLAMMNSIGPDAIVYLLDLRRRVGPLGTHVERLYTARNGNEMTKLGAEMKSKGVMTPDDFYDTDALRALFAERIRTMAAGTKAFVALPIGSLAGPDGIIEELRTGGVNVEAIR